MNFYRVSYHTNHYREPNGMDFSRDFNSRSGALIFFKQLTKDSKVDNIRLTAPRLRFG